MALLDIDPQGSLSALARTFADQEGRVPEPVIERNSFPSYTELEKRLTAYDVVVIDTPPYLFQELREVFKITNLVLVPCKASPLDFLAIGDTLNFIREARQSNRLRRPAGPRERRSVLFQLWLS